MTNNLEDRLLPSGHPHVYFANLPQLQPLTQLQPIPQLSQVAQVHPLPPLSQLTQLPQNISMARGPFEQILNSGVYPISSPSLGLGMQIPFFDAISAHFPFLPQTFNSCFPLGSSSLTMMKAPKTPVPLMSLRISTPPTLRPHPYQIMKERSESTFKKTRHRNNSFHSVSRLGNCSVQIVENRAMQFYQHPAQSAPLQKMESESSEKEEASRLPL